VRETVTLNRDIYPNLKLRMYTTGIRQNRLARMLGIHEASLSRIMNGFREPTGDIRVHLGRDPAERSGLAVLQDADQR
jgi:transcriptional regulator with XRE-family HTH domain